MRRTLLFSPLAHHVILFLALTLYRERTITQLKNKSGLIAKIQLLLFLYPITASLLSHLLFSSCWAFIGLALNVTKYSILFQCYIIVSFIPIILSFLVLSYSSKFIPNFYQIWWDTWKIFSQKMSKNGFNEYEARRELRIARHHYNQNGKPLRWLIYPLMPFLIGCITNPDLLKAIFSVSLIDIFHINQYGGYALLVLPAISIIYYIKYALPVAWLQNTIDRIELEGLS